MKAEVAEFYHLDAWSMSPTALAEAHSQIDTMHSVRTLREEWDKLTPYGVKLHATIAHGPVIAEQEMVRKVTEQQNRDAE